MKKAFSLIELIIIISIILVVTYLVVPSFNFKNKSNITKYNIENIKEQLLKNYDYNDFIELICLKNRGYCLLNIDGNFKENKINLFKNNPDIEVYNYKFQKIYYESFNNKTYFNEEVNYILKISKSKSSDNIIALNDKEFFVFNSLYQKPKKYLSLQKIKKKFENNKNRLLNAI
ncbi:hypothetical protein [Arcobacter sp. CECT 8985]|uniref:hypothetical protein n=1 Tax=Arcobacter sp. CECT 8985 TaxID=1935424 RepID=UPI00100ADE58|nr:hypothetical protein [Arcobacter sp. CECT 8985]RXJ86037.1 hypothetical protein CRU93_10270 [Arcobacter sp. CECT 8985]